MSNPVLFQPPIGFIDVSFWEELYRRKLNDYRLSTAHVPITTQLISIGINQYNIVLNKDSFDSDAANSARYQCGQLHNMNTINEFKSLNKEVLLNDISDTIWNAIVSGDAVRDPSLLLNFVLLTYADLKSYKFVSWLGFPSFVANIPICHVEPPSPASCLLSNEQFEVFVPSVLGIQNSFFALRVGADITAHNLDDVWDNRNNDDIVFCFYNYLTSADSTNIPWSVRNLLALLGYHSTQDSTYRILVLSAHSLEASTLYKVFIPATAYGTSRPRVVGWHPNEAGNPAPRLSDLRHLLDSKEIMNQAVDLNIRLMKWRAWPDLDTDKLASTKCLLIGAGTLGCAVARTLMGWGVRDITFVDNGVVSFSNPARQSLYEYEDCVAKRYKAEAAADRLMKIFPGMRASGVVMTVPMPGHPIIESEKETVRSQYNQLDSLIQTHDVVFLLTDSREARWLPTVMCGAYDKLLINTALGFDSYLIMRHGHAPTTDTKESSRLGCYFCSDIVAPGNSTHDRSLDQQCTVTRAGLAQIASGIAVEIMVTVLHTPQGHHTPAAAIESGAVIPHQIRGFLHSFTQINPICECYPYCTACSVPIISEFRQAGFDFVERACRDNSILETLSGVAEQTKIVEEDLRLMEQEEDDW